MVLVPRHRDLTDDPPKRGDRILLSIDWDFYVMAIEDGVLRVRDDAGFDNTVRVTDLRWDPMARAWRVEPRERLS